MRLSVSRRNFSLLDGLQFKLGSHVLRNTKQQRAGVDKRIRLVWSESIIKRVAERDLRIKPILLSLSHFTPSPAYPPIWG